MSLSIKQLPDVPVRSARAATTANITLSGTQTIDGVALSVGDRVLVKNQTTGSQNGVYVVAAGAWARAVDFSSDTVTVSPLLVLVSEGTSNSKAAWMMTTALPITMGSTSLAFEVLKQTASGGDAGAVTQAQLLTIAGLRA